MNIEYLSSYDRSFRKLSPSTQAQTIAAVDQLLAYFATGQRPLGLGLRRLRHAYWEIRAGIDTRIFFELRNDRLTMILVGNHDQIHRLLKRV